MPIIDEIVERLKVMPQSLQMQVLEFTQNLDSLEVRGTKGLALLSFAGSICIEDLKLISEAIQQDCSKVDLDEW